MRYDAHHHFWKYSKEEYGWIGDQQTVLKRDYLPADLEKEIRAARIHRVVTVQARTSLEDTRWMLELAQGKPWIAGVVGWVPLTDANVEQHLERYTADIKFRGVREVLQGLPDDSCLKPEFQRGVALLKDYRLVYDILIVERQLPSAIQLVDRNPRQTFVLDHVAKPRIKDGLMEPWRQNIRELAKRPNVFCKLSGMVTEADPARWSAAQLKPYVDTVLEAFTPKRLMFGSDWPVSRLGVEYGSWVTTVEHFLSAAEQQQVFERTCPAAYGLPQG